MARAAHDALVMKRVSALTACCWFLATRLAESRWQDSRTTSMQHELRLQ